jgi:predicted DsbA family dithiol-disulfide isomerase
MERLLFYHDFNSAYCRVGLVAARDAARSAGLSLVPLPFELFPAPDPLPSPTEAFDDEIARSGPLAEEQGVQLTRPPAIARTRKAHEAVEHARTAGLELVLVEALYDAVWRDGLDIGRLDSLAHVAASVGVDPAGLLVALGLDIHAADVADAQRTAVEGGIREVPAFRVGGEVLTGAVPTARLLDWLDARR